MNIIIDIILILGWCYIYFIPINHDNIKHLAIKNAFNIINLERKLNIFIEEIIQNYFFINWPTIIKILNIYYIYNHYISIILLLIYVLINNTIHLKLILYCGSCINIIISKLYPTMPPRLLNSNTIYGGNLQDFKFKDNTVRINNKSVENKFNNYSCIPSLHIFFAIWVSHCLYTIYGNYLFFLNIILTYLCIIITGHHYIIDGIISIMIYIFVVYSNITSLLNFLT